MSLRRALRSRNFPGSRCSLIDEVGARQNLALVSSRYRARARFPHAAERDFSRLDFRAHTRRIFLSGQSATARTGRHV